MGRALQVCFGQSKSDMQRLELQEHPSVPLSRDDHQARLDDAQHRDEGKCFMPNADAQVPAGIFIPALAIGALMGRLVGFAMELLQGFARAALV